MEEVVDTKMNYNEVLEYFNYSKKDDVIYLPNEIFKDLDVPFFKTNRHKAFGYAYYYLASYLYRNIKYLKIDNPKKLYSMNLLEALGVNQPKLNYITRKGGVLDSIDYTISTSDYPIALIFDDESLVEFEMASSCNEEMRKYLLFPSTMVLKYPRKGFYRDNYDKEYTGTFFSFENTHKIPFEVFAKCLSEEEDNFELFFLYGFLKAFEGYINSKDVYMEYLRVSLGFGNKKVKRLVQKMVSLGLMKLNHSRLLRYTILE